jgi:hypothetical protein
VSVEHRRDTVAQGVDDRLGAAQAVVDDGGAGPGRVDRRAVTSKRVVDTDRSQRGYLLFGKYNHPPMRLDRLPSTSFIS